MDPSGEQGSTRGASRGLWRPVAAVPAGSSKSEIWSNVRELLRRELEANHLNGKYIDQRTRNAQQIRGGLTVEGATTFSDAVTHQGAVEFQASTTTWDTGNFIAPRLYVELNGPDVPAYPIIDFNPPSDGSEFVVLGTLGGGSVAGIEIMSTGEVKFYRLHSNVSDLQGSVKADPDIADALRVSDGTQILANEPPAELDSLTNRAYITGRHAGLDVLQELGSVIKAATLDPYNALANFTLTDQQARLHAIYVPYDMTLTGVCWVQNIQGNYTANNNNKIALYTVSGTTYTQVAQCANDGNLWKSASASFVQKAFTTPYAASGGTVLYIGMLWCRSAVTTAPIILGGQASPSGFSSRIDLAAGTGLANVINGSTDLGSSISASGGSTQTPFLGVY